MSEEIKFFGTAILVIVLAITGLVKCTGETDKEKADIYAAWCKMHDCKSVSQNEFELLRDKGLLPGQSVNSDDNFAIGLATGLATGK